MAAEIVDGQMSDSDRVLQLERRLQNLERENRHLRRTVNPPTPSPVQAGLGKEDEVPCSLETVADIDLNEVLDDVDEESWVYESPVKPSPQQRLLTPEQWLLQGLHDDCSSTTASHPTRDALKDVRANLDFPKSVASSTEYGVVSNTPEERLSGRSTPDSTGSNSTFTVSPPPLLDDEEMLTGSPELPLSFGARGDLGGTYTKSESVLAPFPTSSLASGMTGLPSFSSDRHVEEDSGESDPSYVLSSHVASSMTAGPSRSLPCSSRLSGLSRPTSGLSQPSSARSSGLTQPRPSSAAANPRASALAQPRAASALAQSSVSSSSGLPSSANQRTHTQTRSGLAQPGLSRLSGPSTARPASAQGGMIARSASVQSGLVAPAAASRLVRPSSQASALPARAASLRSVRGASKSGLKGPQSTRPSSGLRAPSSYAAKKTMPRPSSTASRPTVDSWKDGCV